MNIKEFSLPVGSKIKDALALIDQNARGVCFIVENEKLKGVATDGDIRRGLLSGYKLNDSIETVMNNEYVSLLYNESTSKINELLTNGIKLIPLIDEENRLIDIADALKGHKVPVLEPELSGNELAYVTDCVKTSWISSQGKYVKEFENIFSRMHEGYRYHAIAVSNGTVALQLTLEALGIKEGDEVIVPDLTFIASVNAIIHAGARPLLCEIEKDTWNIDPIEAKKLITSNTKAIMPVHLYGLPCNMEKIVNLAKKHKLLIIEDAAESLGSKYDGKRVGTFGDASAFSFFGNKTITTGEGGMVLLRNGKQAEIARKLRDHGMNINKRYWHDTIGHNFRMTNMQAAIGVAQMERFNEIIEKKRKIANWYNFYLDEPVLISQKNNNLYQYENSFWLYTVLINTDIDRDELMTKLLKNGIDTRPVFYPVHSMPPYKRFNKSRSLKNSIFVSERGISLPSSIKLKENEIREIAQILNSFIS